MHPPSPSQSPSSLSRSSSSRSSSSRSSSSRSRRGASRNGTRTRNVAGGGRRLGLTPDDRAAETFRLRALCETSDRAGFLQAVRQTKKADLWEYFLAIVYLMGDEHFCDVTYNDIVGVARRLGAKPLRNENVPSDMVNTLGSLGVLEKGQWQSRCRGDEVLKFHPIRLLGDFQTAGAFITFSQLTDDPMHRDSEHIDPPHSDDDCVDEPLDDDVPDVRDVRAAS